MITIGDLPSSLMLVKVVPDLVMLVADEDPDEGVVLDVAQWQATGNYFCEFQDDPDRDCDSSSVCWGTSDEYEPKLCTNHYFESETGYDFVARAA